MTLDPLNGTAAEIAAQVNRHEVSARDLTRRALDRISQLDELVNAFTDVPAHRALDEADLVDARVARGERLPLAGVPFAAKNLFDIEGITTRAGSMINRRNPPAAEDATLVARLKAAGAICLGALHMGEYAYDFTGQNAHDGNCSNPHDLTRISGGSSSGSGAALAAGMVALTLGSDTNGSIRVPSSFCGVFGLKPTYGRLTRHGSFPFTHSLDHLGPMARSVLDLALAYDAMAGADPADAAQSRRAAEPTAPGLQDWPVGLKVAVAGGWFRDQGDPKAHAAVDLLAKALGTDRVVSIPEAERARAAAYVITNAESSALHLERLKTRAADYDPDTRDRFLAGTMVPAAWYVAAQRFRAWFRTEILKLFGTVDVLLAPATPFQALKADQRTMVLGGVEMPARPNIGVFTQPISFAGLPVVAVPVWLDGERMPIGVQVIAAPWREDVALKVAALLERQGVVRAPIALVSG